MSNAFGMTIYHQSDSEPINPQLIPDMQMLGLTWLRYQLRWSFIESPQGTYHWQATDQIVSLCAAAGINLIFDMCWPPAWGLNSVACSDGQYYPNAAAMAAFATVLVARYGNAFQSIEIGNEEHTLWWVANSCLNTQYPPVAQAVFTALRNGGYTGKIGATALYLPGIGGGGAMTTTTWVNNFYAPTNIAHLFDYLSFHYYNGANDPSVTTTDYQSITAWIVTIQAALAANGDPNKPIWLSEFGWSVRGASNVVTEKQRAVYYLMMYMACMPRVEKILFYTMDSFPLNNDNQTITYGQQPAEVYSPTFQTVQQFIAAQGDFMGLLEYDTGARGSPITNGWGTATDGNAWTLNAGGNTNQSTTTTQLQINAGGLFEIIGASNSLDCLATVRATINASGDGPIVFLRYTNTQNYIKCDVAGGLLRIRKNVAGTLSNVATASLTLTTGVAYWFKFQVKGTTYSARAWLASSSDPVAWTISGTASDSALASGYWGLSATSAGQQVQYDNFSIASLGNTTLGNHRAFGRLH